MSLSRKQLGRLRPLTPCIFDARWKAVTRQARRTHLSETPAALGNVSRPAPLPALNLDFALLLQQPNFNRYRTAVTFPPYTGAQISQGIAAAEAAVDAAQTSVKSRHRFANNAQASPVAIHLRRYLAAGGSSQRLQLTRESTPAREEAEDSRNR
jgi:hypothetical protein